MAMPSDEELVREALTHLGGLYGLATQAERDGRFGDAEGYLRERLRLLPGDPVASYALSQLLLARGEYREGFKLYEARCALTQFSSDVRKPISSEQAL